MHAQSGTPAKWVGANVETGSCASAILATSPVDPGSMTGEPFAESIEYRIMDYANITLEIAEKVATITFNRPGQLNAISNRLLDEPENALARIAAYREKRKPVYSGR